MVQFAEQTPKDTKRKADVAETAAVLRLLKMGFNPLVPVGDRLPYDIAIDASGRLIKLQVKAAWLRSGNYTVDTRRTKTNRRSMVRDRYTPEDFDFALLYLEDRDIFYVMPFDVFESYKSGITIVEKQTRQRKPKSHEYREAWHLIK